MLLARLFERLIKTGRLTMIDATGKRHVFGPEGGEPDVMIRLHDKALHRKLFFNADMYVGEAYMDGTLTIEGGTLYEFLDLCAINLEAGREHPLPRALDWSSARS